MENYLQARSLTRLEFASKKTDLASISSSTLTSPEDIKKIERVLDLGDGILEGSRFYLSEANCECGRKLSFYDFVFTALIEQWHSPSFLAHTLTGAKYFVNESRPIRCSQCGRTYHDQNPVVEDRRPAPIEYETPRYGCCYR